MKYLGCAYYPEYWGSDRFEQDALLMKEAKMNVVRVGEFAWSRMEPEENRFTLEWLHMLIRVMAKHDISVIMCTPSAAPPAWLTSSYKDTLLVKADGVRYEHGIRRNYCYTSETFRKFVYRIVDKLSKEFSVYTNIIGWQIDNEPDFLETGICFCETCQRKFQDWLKRKYFTVKKLNSSWATGFWSMDYNDWNQVRLAPCDRNLYSSSKLDTMRFASCMLTEFILSQAEIIRRNDPGATITTNLNGEVFTGLDYSKIYSELDVASKDLYFDICSMDVNALIMNQFRSFKPDKKFWITETGAGAIDLGRPSFPKQFKAWMWSSYAHGADAYVVFRWRTCLSGQEQDLQGILEHSGYPGHRYKAVKEAFTEMTDLSGKLGNIEKPKAEVAFVHEYDNKWGYDSSAVNKEISYDKNFCRLHEEFYKKNVIIDVISPETELASYKLVVIPSLMMIDRKFAERVKHYVSSGGMAFAQGQIGMRDHNDNYLKGKGPENLQDLFGVQINGGMYLYSQAAPDEALKRKRRDFGLELSGMLINEQIYGKAYEWAGDLELTDAVSLLTYQDDTYKGQPAVVEKYYGNGRSIYAAVMKFDAGTAEKLIEYVLDAASAVYYRNIPEYLEIVKTGDITFLINHNEYKVKIENIQGEPLQGTIEEGMITLNQYDVAIIKNMR